MINASYEGICVECEKKTIQHWLPHSKNIL